MGDCRRGLAGLETAPDEIVCMINPILCSPVISARIVVFPSTQLFREFSVFLASCPLLYFTRAMPWGK